MKDVNNHKIFTFLFILKNFVLLFLTIYTFSYTQNSPELWIRVYFILVLSLIQRFALSDFLKSKSIERFDAHTFLCAIAVMAITLIIGLKFYATYSIWLDESEHGLASLWVENLFTSAAEFQQQPIDYIWRALSLYIFGTNEFGLRFVSVASYSLFSSIMFINFYALLKNRIFALGMALALALNYNIVTYAVEARPYAISLFYFSIFLYFLIKALIESSLSKSNNFLLVGGSAWLWLCSISMQPLLILSSIAAVSLVLFIKSEYSLIAKKLLINLLSALLLFIPMLLFVIQRSSRYLKPSLDVSWLQKYDLWELFWPFKVLMAQTFLQELIVILFFIIAAIAIFQRPKFKIFYIVAGVLILYVFFHLILFYSIVKWQMSERYILTLVPMVYISVAFYLSLVRKFQMPLIVAIVALSIVSFAKDPLGKPVRDDWRGLYSKVLELTPENSNPIVFFYSFETDPNWVDEYVIAYEYYQVKERPIFLVPKSATKSPEFSTNSWVFDFFSSAKSGTLFFVIKSKTGTEADNNVRKWAIANGSLVIDFNIFKIIKFQGDSKRLFQLTLDFYKNLPKFDRSDIGLAKSFDGQFLLYLSEKNCQLANAQLAEYEKSINQNHPYHLVRLTENSTLYSNYCKTK